MRCSFVAMTDRLPTDSVGANDMVHGSVTGSPLLPGGLLAEPVVVLGHDLLQLRSQSRLTGNGRITKCVKRLYTGCTAEIKAEVREAESR